MKTAKARMIFDCLRRAVQPSVAGLTDGQLLRQYFTHRDETAFAALVRRHGPMVLAVCRRLLRSVEDAEDAFQAAFIVLARKGHRVAGQPTVGGWLHGVAYHVALTVRNRVARRQIKRAPGRDPATPARRARRRPIRAVGSAGSRADAPAGQVPASRDSMRVGGPKPEGSRPATRLARRHLVEPVGDRPQDAGQTDGRTGRR